MGKKGGMGVLFICKKSVTSGEVSVASWDASATAGDVSVASWDARDIVGSGSIGVSADTCLTPI